MVVCCGGGSDQTVEESKVSIVQSFKVNNTWRPEPLVTIRKLVVRDISEVQRYPGLEQLFNDLDTIFHVSILSNIVILFKILFQGARWSAWIAIAFILLFGITGTTLLLVFHLVIDVEHSYVRCSSDFMIIFTNIVPVPVSLVALGLPQHHHHPAHHVRHQVQEGESHDDQDQGVEQVGHELI